MHFKGTFPLSINPGGVITGNFIDAGGTSHGFIRAADGSFTTFDAGPQGTNPVSISSSGEITGWFQANSMLHGFVLKTSHQAAAED